MKGKSYLATDYAVFFSHLSLSTSCGQISSSQPCFQTTCIFVVITEISGIFHRFILRNTHRNKGICVRLQVEKGKGRICLYETKFHTNTKQQARLNLYMF